MTTATAMTREVAELLTAAAPRFAELDARELARLQQAVNAGEVSYAEADRLKGIYEWRLSVWALTPDERRRYRDARSIVKQVPEPQ